VLAALFTNAKSPLTTVRAWTYLGINLFATPGLGSVMGGRKLAGRGQLLFSVAGFCLIVTWMLKVIFGSTSAEISGVDAPPIPAWWWQVGVLLFGIAWVWSLATSISMVLEAARESVGSVPMVPPKLAGIAKKTPPPLAAPNFKLKSLDGYQISAALATIPAWHRQGANIIRHFQFPDFLAAIHFVNQVAGLAEEAGHHPDIDIRWNRVTLALSTHDVGGLTDRDFALARQFDRLT
jgi:4a-hydroxytetrahydrobiopterin dehydratase